jgi:hypothetical protein
MKFIRIVITFTSLIGLCACTHGPIKNMDFNTGLDLKRLDGTYEDVMESSPGKLGLFSSYIWTYTNDLKNKGYASLNSQGTKVSYVNLTINEYEVTFEAIGNSCIVARKTVDVNDRFDDGEFEIISSYSNISPVHVGPNYMKKTIGLDVTGDAKFRKLERAGGLLFWFIPFAIFETWDYKINKLDEKIIFPECEHIDS